MNFIYEFGRRFAARCGQLRGSMIATGQPTVESRFVHAYRGDLKLFDRDAAVGWPGWSRELGQGDGNDAQFRVQFRGTAMMMCGLFMRDDVSRP